MTELRYQSSQEAWEGLNERFLKSEDEMVSQGATRSSGLIIDYDYLVHIGRLWVDPEFDFGKMFNYRSQKWNSLVSNYVNLDYLDLVKSEVLTREKKKAAAYNISFLFDNSHASGKGCLLSLTFAKRHNGLTPILIATLRSSEIVKRLNFDFLLMQRIGEYVYGPKPVAGIIYFPNLYTAAETSALYHKHKSLKRLFKDEIKADTLKPFQKRVWEGFLKYSQIDQDSISYKVNLRVARALQNKDIPPLLAKNLSLVKK
jgi:hypothetical protein